MSFKALADQTKATGRFDRRAIMSMAIERTRRELAAFAAAGLARTFRQELPHQLRLVWQVVKTAMDRRTAERAAAALTTTERAARYFDLRAELAEGHIPPRSVQAAAFRAFAAELRNTQSQRAA